MATHSSILAWKIPQTEEPGRLKSMGLKRFGNDLATEQLTLIRHTLKTDTLMFISLYFFKGIKGSC